MKKVTSIILAMILLVSAVSMVSCKKSTAEVYVETMAKFALLDALETEMTIEMTMKVPGMDEEMKIEMDILSKTDKLKTDSPVSYAQVSTEMIGQSVKATSYIEGDYIYINTMGQKMKVSLENAEDIGYSSFDSDNYSIDIPEDMLYYYEIDGYYFCVMSISDME